jgi:hypothetical protein
LRPYLGDSGFGQKYESVIKQLKNFMSDYEFKNRLQIGPFMEVAPYLLSRTKRSPYGYLEGENGIWFTFHENEIQNNLEEVATNEVISNTVQMNKQEAKRMIKKSKKKKKALKDIHGDFTKKNVKQMRFPKENKKMNCMSYKNSCR